MTSGWTVYLQCMLFLVDGSFVFDCIGRFCVGKNFEELYRVLNKERSSASMVKYQIIYSFIYLHRFIQAMKYNSVK